MVREASSETASSSQKLFLNTTLQLPNLQKAKAVQMLAEKATGNRDIRLYRGFQTKGYQVSSDKEISFTNITLKDLQRHGTLHIHQELDTSIRSV